MSPSDLGTAQSVDGSFATAFVGLRAERLRVGARVMPANASGLSHLLVRV